MPPLNPDQRFVYKMVQIPAGIVVGDRERAEKRVATLLDRTYP
jgi:hypothetical protein